jgi:hypothetical protein
VPVGVRERIAATPRIRPAAVARARRHLDVRPAPSADELAKALMGNALFHRHLSRRH